MNKEDLIQLTNKLYRLTLLFPKKEPLRYKMRELATEILINPSGKHFEALDSFFEVAKSQNWVSPSELLAIQKEYSKIKEGLNETEARPLIISDKSQVSGNPFRHQRILEILKEKEKVQVWEIKKIFPEVTKRTLRRDFEQLLKKGKIERRGERNETFYRLPRVGQGL